MFVTCLNEQQKDDVVDRYVNHEESQSDIAAAYVVSRRTIQRVLQERGVLTDSREVKQCTVSDVALLGVVKKHNIFDPNTLNDALSRPVLSHTNVLVYLCRLEDEIFEKHIEAVRKARAMAKQEATNA
jgi:hypothetical protein